MHVTRPLATSILRASNKTLFLHETVRASTLLFQAKRVVGSWSESPGVSTKTLTPSHAMALTMDIPATGTPLARFRWCCFTAAEMRQVRMRLVPAYRVQTASLRPIGDRSHA